MTRDNGHRPLVAHVIDRLPPDGAERLLADVLCFRADEFDFAVVCLIEGGELQAEIESYGVPVYVLNCRNGWDLSLFPRLWRWIRDNRPAIVHTHLFTADAWARLVARLIGSIGIMTTVHSTNDWKQFHHRLIDRLLARASDRIFACTSAVKEQLSREFSASVRDRIVTVENGINTSRVIDLTGQTHADVGSNNQCIAIIGRLHEAKGHGVLLDALGHLKSVGLEPDLLVIGDGPLRSELTTRVDDLGLGSQVHFLGFQRNPFGFLHQVNVVAMPSIWEGLPMALLEVMAAGKAVVASTVGGIGMVITDEVDGLVIPPADSRELADKLERVLRNPQLQLSLGSAARETALGKYDVRRVAATYEQSYRVMLNGAGSQ